VATVQRDDVVHTPAGWALVLSTFDVLAVHDGAPDGECSRWVAVLLEGPNGDEPTPAVFRCDEVEPQVPGPGE
jgi:hypothetical protein